MDTLRPFVKRMSLYVVALLMLIFVPKTFAADVNKTSSPVAKMLLETAVNYWGRSPNCEKYELLVGPILDHPELSNVAGEAPLGGCWMRLIPEVWVDSNEPIEPTPRLAVLCTIVVHEYGHSLGEPHNENPQSVMDLQTEYTTGEPLACKQIQMSWEWNEETIIDEKAKERASLEERVVREREKRLTRINCQLRHRLRQVCQHHHHHQNCLASTQR